MSTHKVKTILSGAILIANNLESGRTVYRTRDANWSELIEDAWILTDTDVAHQLQQEAVLEATSIIDPYLVATDKNGKPEHIREAIRLLGPTFQNTAEYLNQGYHFVGQTGVS